MIMIIIIMIIGRSRKSIGGGGIYVTEGHQRPLMERWGGFLYTSQNIWG